MAPKVVRRGDQEDALRNILMDMDIIQDSHRFIEGPNGIKFDKQVDDILQIEKTNLIGTKIR